MASPSFDFAAVAGVELPPNVRYVGIRHRDASLRLTHKIMRTPTLHYELTP